MSTQARLRALVALADTGSVRAAARRLVVTESSVSSAITALAAEVGVPLLDRDGRGVRLTAAGSSYAGYARRILGLHHEALVAARGADDAEAGTVRIAAVTTAGEHLLPALLASFRAEHPGVGLGLEVAPKDAVWSMLAHHEVDLVVAGRPPDTLTGRIRAVRPNTLAVVGAPVLAGVGTPASGGVGAPASGGVGAPVLSGVSTPASSGVADRVAGRVAGPVAGELDLGAVTWLLREPGSGIRGTTAGLLRALEITPPTMTLGSHGAVVAAAVAGLGVTLVSRQAVAQHLSDGALIELQVRGTPLQRPWHAVSALEPSPSTELLVAHLLSRTHLGWHPPSTLGEPGTVGSAPRSMLSEPSTA